MPTDYPEGPRVLGPSGLILIIGTPKRYPYSGNPQLSVGHEGRPQNGHRANDSYHHAP